MHRYLLAAALCSACGGDPKPSAKQSEEGFNSSAASSAEKIKFIAAPKNNPVELSDKAHEMINNGEVSGKQAAMLEMINGKVIQSQVKIVQLGISDPDPAVQHAAKKRTMTLSTFIGDFRAQNGS